MRRVELEVEHRFKDKFMGRYWFKSSEGQAVFGSARDNDIRLLGDDVAGIHAIAEFYNNDWVLSDLGSSSGTWIRKNAIVEQPLKTQTIVRIGQHVLRFTPREIKNDLFVNKRSIQEKVNGPEIFHQVVLKKHDYVVRTMLLGKSQSYTYFDGQTKHIVKPPQEEGFREVHIGNVTIVNRLTSTRELHQSNKDKVMSLMDPSLKKPMAFAGMLIVFLMLALLFAPNMPNQELKEIAPKNNVYTRIIYDSGSQKKQKAKASKSQSKIANSRAAQAQDQPAKKQTATTPKHVKSQAVVKVSSALKKAGLSNLISKIAKRASSNSFLIQSKGQAPDQGTTGRALASVGRRNIGDPKAAVGNSFKVKGVSTSGKGGGSSSYKGISGLSSGGVGSSNVGIVEEETEISGGLDRSVISKYIQSQLGQVRYCYERQLSANPEIRGKILVKFTIGGNGKVISQAIGTTTLKNAMVEGCILRRISGWKFPTPEGGTLVMVSYPFLFNSSN
ncbi:MAG: AgmX/PglI C-terminal domain-containing protein [Bdellovibrionales bacterium]|nr:AgmX/PglI C-terminal domain-containing protein [Bdellovibrionales bacterium]